MIVVTIALWPKGDEKKERGLGVLVITNDGTGDAEFGNYRYTLSHAGKYFGGYVQVNNKDYAVALPLIEPFTVPEPK